MPADPVLSRELKSLQEELATARRQRPAQFAGEPTASSPGAGTGAGAAAVGESPTPSGGREESAAEQELSGQLRDLVKEVTDFVNDAEKNIAAHPAMSIVAAMLLGMVIGSLLARR